MVKKFNSDASDAFLSAGKTESTEEEIGAPKGYRLMPEAKSARLQLLVTPSTKEDLQRIADLEGRSLNAVCNDAIQEYLSAYQLESGE